MSTIAAGVEVFWTTGEVVMVEGVILAVVCFVCVLVRVVCAWELCLKSCGYVFQFSLCGFWRC